jgi:hypothetical protein
MAGHRIVGSLGRMGGLSAVAPEAMRHRLQALLRKELAGRRRTADTLGESLANPNPVDLHQ